MGPLEAESQRKGAMRVADNPYPLGSLGLQIKDHCKRHRPKMYAALARSGQLRASLYAAQELTTDAMYDLEVVKKLPHDQAWELVREEWAFLPSEDDVPDLGFDPAALAARLTESPTRSPTCGEARNTPRRTIMSESNRHLDCFYSLGGEPTFTACRMSSIRPMPRCAYCGAE